MRRFVLALATLALVFGASAASAAEVQTDLCGRITEVNAAGEVAGIAVGDIFTASIIVEDTKTYTGAGVYTCVAGDCGTVESNTGGVLVEGVFDTIVSPGHPILTWTGNSTIAGFSIPADPPEIPVEVVFSGGTVDSTLLGTGNTRSIVPDFDQNEPVGGEATVSLTMTAPIAATLEMTAGVRGIGNDTCMQQTPALSPVGVGLLAALMAGTSVLMVRGRKRNLS